MTTPLAEVCDDLAAWLPRAAALTTTQDAAAGGTRTQPSSRPPWNPAAASAVYDTLETIRRTEQQVRAEVTGRPQPRQPHARTGDTLTAIPRLAEALDDTSDITRQLHRQLATLLRLDAIGEREPVVKVLGATCPYCGYRMLLAALQSARVTCARPDCLDTNGDHPRGIISEGAASGQPLIAWADGTTQHPAAA